jgi:hypothetical protein
MPDVELNTTELRKMVDEATKKAINKHLTEFKSMAGDVAEIKKALLGSEFNSTGMINKVDTMWTSHQVCKDTHEKVTTLWKFYTKWDTIITFFGIGSLAGILAVVYLVADYIIAKVG